MPRVVFVRPCGFEVNNQSPNICRNISCYHAKYVSSLTTPVLSQWDWCKIYTTCWVNPLRPGYACHHWFRKRLWRLLGLTPLPKLDLCQFDTGETKFSKIRIKLQKLNIFFPKCEQEGGNFMASAVYQSFILRHLSSRHNVFFCQLFRLPALI